MVERAKNKFLVVAVFFPPTQDSGTYRTLRLIKYLDRFGWGAVAVVPRSLPILPTEPSLLEDLPPGTEIHRVSFPHLSARGLADFLHLRRSGQSSPAAAPEPAPSKFPRTRFRCLLRLLEDNLFIPDHYLLFLPPAVFRAWRLIQRGDIKLIYTTASPATNHLIGYLLKRWTGLPWVTDFRDFWVDLPRGRPLPRWRKKLESYLEKVVLRSADRVLTYSDGIGQNLAAKVGNGYRPKFITITAGVDEEKFNLVPKRKFEHFTLAYVGRYSYLYSVTIFAAAAAFARECPTFRFLVAGPVDAPVAQALKPEWKGPHLELRGKVSHSEAIAIMKGADCLYFPLPESAEFSWWVPGKLAEYALAGVPILATVPEGDAKNYFHSLPQARVVSARVEDLVSALRHLHHSREHPPMVKVDETVRRHFSAAAQAEVLASLFQGLAHD